MGEPHNYAFVPRDLHRRQEVAIATDDNNLADLSLGAEQYDVGREQDIDLLLLEDWASVFAIAAVCKLALSDHEPRRSLDGRHEFLHVSEALRLLRSGLRRLPREAVVVVGAEQVSRPFERFRERSVFKLAEQPEIPSTRSRGTRRL